VSDYIPTTEEVRDEYSGEFSDSKAAKRAFDLWLAQYEAKIIAKTEERIIKLLKSLDCEADGKEHDCNPLDQYTITDLIELIKGEQK
jgi:hypothetical protein